MPQKSRWDSDFWKGMKALSIVLAIIVASLTILQWLGSLDVYNILVMPVANFFTAPVPLYSIPVTIIIVLVLVFLLALSSGSNTLPAPMTDPLAGAEILDNPETRYLALLCQTPQTTGFLQGKHQEMRARFRPHYSSKECLERLEKGGLLVFDRESEKWQVTQKALDYIAKYHGD